MKRSSDKKSIVKAIAVAAAAVTAAVSFSLGISACVEEEKKEYTVEFISAEHVEYSVIGYDEINKPWTEGSISVAEGASITFSVNLDENYTLGEVKANSTVLSQKNGVYSFTVNEDTEVTVSGVAEAPVTLRGQGTSEAPYLIASLRELNYITGEINDGNPNFVLAYYQLDADIDCGGAHIGVIGNGVSDTAFFGGNFDGAGHTVSNYVIETTDLTYVGFFGIVQQYVAQGAELDENSGVIKNLKLKDFTIDAHAAEGSSVIAGSVVGFGIAVKVINCDVTGGTLNVTGNDRFLGYAGGVIGIMQSAMTTGSRQDSATGETYEEISPYYSSINAVHTNVDITTSFGLTLAAGGIAAYVITYNPMAPAYITNCYSESRIFGAIRVGGIAGSLNDGSAVINCYSTGEYEATSTVPVANPEYDAAAGGLVGYAGLNTAIVGSFTTAEVYAESANGAEHATTGDLVGYCVPANSTQNEVSVYNCFYGEEAKGTQASFVSGTLKWSASDWKITDGALPQLNGEIAAGREFNLSVNFGGQTVDGKSSIDVKINSGNYYLPIIDHFRYSDSELVEVFITSDNKTAYGYFFDDKLTCRVPYGYAPVGDVTLYVGFADYTKIAGEDESGKTYYYEINGRTVELTLYNWGEFVYTDGIKIASTYTYDGAKIIFADAPFARLSEVILENAEGEPSPSLNYDRYSFACTVEENGLLIYDDSYFAEKTILFSNANPSVAVDVFEGEWEKSASVNKVYSFDGNGGWTYAFMGETISGQYTVSGGVATMTLNGGEYASAVIDASGLLAVTRTGKQVEYFGIRGGLLGTWFDENTGNYVILNGYGSSNFGDVIVSVDGNVSQLNYIRDGFFDGEGGYGLTIISPTNASLFGYLNYDEKTKILSGALYSGMTGELVGGNSFRLVDNYSGEWIGEDGVDGVDFTLMNFNGFGTYSVQSPAGIVGSLGYVEINGQIQRVEYSVDVDGGLRGTFTYNNIVYNLSFDDERNEVIVSKGDEEAVLTRKDELYTYTLVDSLNTYRFNGGGNLSGGGTLTVESATGAIVTYTYKIKSGSIESRDLIVSVVNDKTGIEGSLTISRNNFVFKENLTAAKGTTLSVKTAFGGNWAISGYMQSFFVGNFDLSGNATGRFQGYDATYEMISDTCIIVSFLPDDDESIQVVQSYIVLADDETLAISNYPYLVSGGYVYAAKQDVLFGEWTHISDLDYVLAFDGLGNSKYENGVAWDKKNNVTYYYTSRFGNFYMWVYNDDSDMYKINFLPRNTQSTDYFGSSSNRFELEKFDAAGSAVCVAHDGATEYKFFIDGSVEINGVSYDYQLVSVSGNKTTLVIDINGETTRAIVDHSEKTVTII